MLAGLESIHENIALEMDVDLNSFYDPGPHRGAIPHG
jgi:hypothetical protein